MPEETNNPQPSQNSSGFVKKAVETPILDSSVKEIIIPDREKPEASGFKAFYAANKIYFWAILAGIIIIGTLAYFAFRKTPQTAPKEANVAINVVVADTVQSGGETVYQISLQNNDSQKLVNVKLELAYPDGVSYISSTPVQPDNLSGSLFSIADLSPGITVLELVNAKFTGNVNDQKTLDLKLHYSYSNFNSEFIKEQTSTVRLVASDVTVQLQGPDTTSNAQLVLYTLNYQNNSQNDIQNARIKMDYPDGFNFASASPAPDLGSDTWNVGTLAKGGSGQITIQGTFASANPGESKTITAEFLILGTDGNYFTQNSATYTTSIASLPLLITQALQQNNADSNNVVNPGDGLNFTVTYQNNAATAATGVNVEVDLNSKVLDPASITAQGAQINNNTIIWNAAGVPALASLLPNQSGQLSFRAKVNSPATKDASTNLTVVSSIKIKSNEYTTAFPGNQLTLKVSSPSAINTALTYVSGQLPPQVGKSTTYQVSISLTNSSNTFSNGILSAAVPGGGFAASSVKSAEAQNTQFDPSTGLLDWNFGNLPANTGRFTSPRVLTFNVTINPSSSDAGQRVTIIKGISFTATDLFTNQPVNDTAQDISTQDLQGQNGYSNGIVQQ
jgi:hypothetical protein